MHLPPDVWTELIKGMPAAFVALIIGAIAGLIAWRQYRVAKAKFRLDLFQQRYEIFEALWEALSTVGHQDAEALAAEIALHNSIPKAHFLYGGEIGRYLEEVNGKISRLKTEFITLQGNQSPADRAITERNVTLLMKWLQEQPLQLRERFSKYLGFTKWH